jgi:predicted murein hydrolase (TIGR00659 family)
MNALVDTPLFGLLLTLGSYRLGQWLYGRSNSFPLLHPFLLAMIPVASLLLWLDIPYERYREQTFLLEFLLGPATVALAWPLYRQLHTIRRVWRPVLITTLAGAGLAGGISLTLAAWLDAPPLVLGSVAPKSITTPIALEVIPFTGGNAPLTAGLVAITGILGALLGPPVFRLMRISDDRVRGFTLGLVGHGIGTARAFEYSERAGAFASLALGLTGAVTATLLPWLWPIIAGWLQP